MTPFKKLVAQHLDTDFSMQTFCSMEVRADRMFLTEFKNKLDAVVVAKPTGIIFPIYWASLTASDNSPYSAFKTKRKRKLNSETAQQLLEKKDAVIPEFRGLIENAIEDRLFEIMPPEEFSYTYWLKNL